MRVISKPRKERFHEELTKFEFGKQRLQEILNQYPEFKYYLPYTVVRQDYYNCAYRYDESNKCITWDYDKKKTGWLNWG
jgi:hypothetical protein